MFDRWTPESPEPQRSVSQRSVSQRPVSQRSVSQRSVSQRPVSQRPASQRQSSRLGWAGALAAVVGLACSAEFEAPSDTPPSDNTTPMGSPSVPPVEPPPDPVEPDFSSLECDVRTPVPAEGRLLTRLQYDNSVRDLFDGRVTASHSHAFPPENKVMGFETNAHFHRASAWLAEGHMKAAENVSEGVARELDELLPCAATAADEACAASFISQYGVRAYRRPLSDAESESLLGLFRTGAQTQGFTFGIQLVVQAMLQSPQFLYRFEIDRSQPMQDAADGFVVTGYEMASRLSYFLWNSMPDETLFAAAENGELATREQIEAQARRMLEDERVGRTLSDFSRQWLGLERLNSAMRDVPGVGERALGGHWQASLDLFMQHAFFEGGDVGTLLSSPTVYMNPTLAALYGVQLPDGTTENEFYPIEFEPDQRQGLITQPGLMAMLAHSDQSTPIQRGVFVLTELLCQPPPDPPPSVDPTPPDPDPNATTRERFAEHTADQACAGCHMLIDPIGLAFENFDHLGRYRADENGLDIDVSGNIIGTREAALHGEFEGARQLAERLSGSQQLRDCLVTQWYRYGSGRVEQEVDLCSVYQVRNRVAQSRGDLRELLLAVATSDAFIYRAESGAGVPASSDALPDDASLGDALPSQEVP